MKIGINNGRITRQQRLKRAAVLLLVLPPSVLAVLPRQTGSGGETRLRLNFPVTSTINGGQSQKYVIQMLAGQFMRVSELKVKAHLTLLDPEGKQVHFVDIKNTDDSRSLSWVAGEAGDYRLELQSVEKPDSHEQYTITLLDLRTATRADESRVAGEKAFVEANHLFQKGTEEATNQALPIYEKALNSFHEAGASDWEANALVDMGVLYLNLGKNDQCFAAWQKARGIRDAMHDIAGAATVVMNLGFVAAQIGHNNEALGYFADAAGLAVRARLPEMQARSLAGMGQTEALLGEYQKALDHYTEAVPVSREIGDVYAEIVTVNEIAKVYQATGRRDQALSEFNRALSMCDANPAQVAARAYTLSNLADFCDQAGETQTALDHYLNSLDLWNKTDRRSDQADTLDRVGLLYAALGDYDTALDYLGRAQDFFKQSGDERGQADGLVGIGEVRALLDQQDKAAESFSQALALEQDMGAKAEIAQTCARQADIYLAAGQTGNAESGNSRSGDSPAPSALDRQKAVALLKRALDTSTAAGDLAGQALALTGLARADLSRGEAGRGANQSDHEGQPGPQAAIGHLDSALALFRTMADRRGEAQALLLKSDAYQAMGRTADAKAAIESSLGLVEGLRKSVSAQSFRETYLASVASFYERYVDLLSQGDASGRDAAGALSASEKMRARSLLDLLSESRLDLKKGVDPVLLARETELTVNLNAMAAERRRLYSNGESGAHAARMSKQIDELNQSLDRVEGEIRAKSPAYAALAHPTPLSARQIREQVLDPDTVLLEFMLGEKRSYLWVSSTASVHEYFLPGRQVIENLAREVYGLIVAMEPQVGESVAEFRSRSRGLETEYWSKAAALSQMLLGQAGADIKGKRLAVVPDGALQYIPFCALPEPVAVGSPSTPPPAGEGASPGRAALPRPIVLSHEVVELPSASALAVLRNQISGRPAAPETLAVFADPVFDPSDARVKAGAVAREGDGSGKISKARSHGARSLRDLDRAFDEVRSGSPADQAGPAKIERLPFTEVEAESIGSLVPASQRFEALGFDATVAAVQKSDLSRYRLIHFATHALLDSRHPGLSGIVLSLVDSQGRPIDGFLRLNEIFNLNLSADLVVLSACETGLGKEIKGEGLIGLTRGFMYAGAPRVVASLWKVNDDATQEVMRRFYRSMLVEHQRPAAALRSAQIQMWNQPRWRLPFYWGAWVLQGEWK